MSLALGHELGLYQIFQAGLIRGGRLFQFLLYQSHLGSRAHVGQFPFYFGFYLGFYLALYPAVFRFSGQRLVLRIPSRYFRELRIHDMRLFRDRDIDLSNIPVSNMRACPGLLYILILQSYIGPILPLFHHVGRNDNLLPSSSSFLAAFLIPASPRYNVGIIIKVQSARLRSAGDIRLFTGPLVLPVLLFLSYLFGPHRSPSDRFLLLVPGNLLAVRFGLGLFYYRNGLGLFHYRNGLGLHACLREGKKVLLFEDNVHFGLKLRHIPLADNLGCEGKYDRPFRELAVLVYRFYESHHLVEIAI